MTNKVFQIELCKEDAQRILNALQLLKDQSYKLIDDCETEEQKTIAWLEWSYTSELLYDMEYKFDVPQW
jgi:hypothetical protein